MRKNSVCRTPYLRNHTLYDCTLLSVALHISGPLHMTVICGTWVETDDISRRFVHFFKILILQIISGVKGQKMTQNDKKLCLSHPISQELYIWSHVKKDNIFQVFFTFLNFLHFLLAHLNRFLVNSCFSSSSISAKQQFWSVPHLHFTKTKLFKNYEKCILFHLKSLFPSRDIHFFSLLPLFFRCQKMIEDKP